VASASRNFRANFVRFFGVLVCVFFWAFCTGVWISRKRCGARECARDCECLFRVKRGFALGSGKIRAVQGEAGFRFYFLFVLEILACMGKGFQFGCYEA